MAEENTSSQAESVPAPNTLSRDVSTDTIWKNFQWGNANWDNAYDNEYEFEM